MSRYDLSDFLIEVWRGVSVIISFFDFFFRYKKWYVSYREVFLVWVLG